MRPNQEFVRLLNNKVTGDPSANYTLSWETDPYPFGGATYGSNDYALIMQNAIGYPPAVSPYRVTNDYWTYRRTTAGNNQYYYAVGLTTSFYPSPRASFDALIGLSGSNTSLHNMIGCNWGITGGSGEYSLEVMLDYVGDCPQSTINHYFAWDISGSTQSYIMVSPYIQLGINRASVSWYINGSSIKQVILNTKNACKIVWNKFTGVSSLYSSSDYIGQPIKSSTSYTFVDSYTVSNTNAPFCFYGNALSTTQSLTFQASQFIVSNHQKRGITGSSYTQTSNPPPLSQMFNPNTKYGSY